MHSLTSVAIIFFGQLPDPGRGEAPPGTEGITTLLRWLAWTVFAACIAGVLASAVSMAIAHHRHGSGFEAVSKLGWALGATIIGASSSALVGALL